MKFKDFKYKRPNYEKIKDKFKNLVKNMETSTNYDELRKNIDEINKLRNHIDSMATLVSIRYSINTEDEFYAKEKEYWDENGPHYEELNSLFYKGLVNSKFKDKLTQDLGKQFMSIADYSLQAFSKEIIAELQEENKLASEYTKLLASAKIPFDGEERNLSGLGPYMTSPFRDEREKSSQAYYGFFEANEKKFDDLFDKLVKVRDKMAKKLGFENFVELGYIRMLRTDYNAEMVESFRKQVSEYIVPVANKLYKRQKERLGLQQFRYFDENFEFNSGNAKPKGDSDFIMKNGILMYSELSKETDEFFKYMMDHELMDLETKKGKGAGGYCTYIPEYKAPFIFSNFNSTADDIDVLTHEAGHAFQVYMSRWIEIPDINFPTYESCEIHSMSMEFITWPWMELFFKEDTDKYKFVHLGSAIKFIPYGVLVDEFQHIIYENPNMTKDERKLVWRDLEKKYQPHKDYEGNDFLERGGWWFKQGHIFKNPFYYIDYTLAQICALQFWKKMQVDRVKGWQDYLNICRIGGTKSFLDIVKYANLKSPFEKGCVSSVIESIDEYLQSINDKNM